jgi:hypothetical protein
MLHTVHPESGITGDLPTAVCPGGAHEWSLNDMPLSDVLAFFEAKKVPTACPVGASTPAAAACCAHAQPPRRPSLESTERKSVPTHPHRALSPPGPGPGPGPGPVAPLKKS